MKKIIALLTVVAVMFAFSACSSKKYKDTEATVPVTDSQGVTVTDKNGDTVTELSTQKEETSGSTTASKEDKTSLNSKTTTKKSENTTKSAKTTKGEKTTKKKEKTTKSKGKETTGDDNKTQGNADKVTTTDKTTDATTTTEKPKKRDITVYVVLPYYNNESAKLTVNYTVEGKEPKPFDEEKITLDGKTTKKYTIKNVKGDVTVRANVIGFSGKDSIHNNKVTVKSNENEVTIKPLTGIGMVDADDEVIE